MAKIRMQIGIANQKTKSTRPASREAGVGSHGSRIATAAAMPPAITPMPISVRMEPLRVRGGAETKRLPEVSPPAGPAATRFDAANRGDKNRYAMQGDRGAGRPDRSAVPGGS